MGEGRIDEARVIRFGGFDRGRRTVVGVREGDFVEETAAVTVVFQQFVIELSPVDQSSVVRLQVLVQRAGLPFGAGILLDVQRAEACAELSEYGDGVAVSGRIDIRPVQRNQGVARIEADAHLLQPLAAEQGEHRFGIVGDASGTVFHAENRVRPYVELQDAMWVCNSLSDFRLWTLRAAKSFPVVSIVPVEG